MQREIEPCRGGRRRRRFGAIAAALAVLAAFSLTACQPSSAKTALKLTLSDTASSGAPAVGVTVSVFPALDISAPAVAYGLTDANGNVVFTHKQLPAGSYEVQFGSGASTTWWPASATRAGATTVAVAADQPIEITGSLAVEFGRVLGEVKDSVGTLISGVHVTAYDAATNRLVDARDTEPFAGSIEYLFYSGTLHLGQTYKFGFTKAGYATVYAGPGGSVVYSLADAAAIAAGLPNTVHVDAVLQPESTITGTVSDGANPVGGEIVGAFVAETGHLALTTTTAADGTFTLHGLSGTGYKLAFITPGNTFAPMVLGAGTGPGASFDLAEGSTFSLQTGGSLSLGTVSLTVGADCATAQDASGTSADLSAMDLRNCELSEADLSTVDLTDANLAGANLSHANLPNGQPSSGDPMERADLSGASLTAANLSHSTSPTGLSMPLDTANLSGADLSYANLSRADLSSSTLIGANLSHTDLGRGRIDNADVSGADLSSPTLEYTFTYDLRWSTPPTIPDGYRLIGDNLVGAGVLLLGADLSGQDLSGMNLSSSKFQSTDFTGANLSNTNLTNSILWTLSLSGADLSGANLTGLLSSGLTSDSSTVLPAGWSIVNGSLKQT